MSAMKTKIYSAQEAADALNKARADFESPNGIARWWAKDGAWHIALPAVNPDPQTGLNNGGFLWTADPYDTREEAIAAIENTAEAR